MNLKDAIGWKLSNGEPTKKAEDHGSAPAYTAKINGHVVGEFQAPITRETSRETAPIMTLGSPNPKSFAQGKRGIAGGAIFESLYGRSMKVGNHTQSYEVGRTPNFLGMHEIPLDYPYTSLIVNTLMVMRNGEGIDYTIDEARNVIMLGRANGSMDNDLEVRYQYDMTENYRLRGVILFPREIGGYKFSDEDLKDFMPSSTDTFDAEKLMRYGNENVDLVKYKNQRLLVEDVRIAEEGIVATLRADQ